MKVSVVISYYKALDNLQLILAGFNRQSVADFEVIISEDDCNEETSRFILEHQTDYQFPIIHLNQEEDLGFRKNMMLNKSIRAATADFLVFIDGDCIPARHFIKEYIKHTQPGLIFWGRRVMLGEKISKKLKLSKSLDRLNFFSTFFSDSTKTKEAIYSPFGSLSFKTRGLKGCNWGVMKSHLIELNGYDEDYVGPGVGEDNDIEWRLEAKGLTKYSMKNKAIVYHIYHARGYSDQGVKENYQMFLDKKAKGHIHCLNGLETLEQEKASDSVPLTLESK